MKNWEVIVGADHIMIPEGFLSDLRDLSQWRFEQHLITNVELDVKNWETPETRLVLIIELIII